MSPHVAKMNRGTRLGAALALSMGVVISMSGCEPDGGGGRKGGWWRARGEGMPPLTDVWPPRAVWVVRQAYDSPAQIAEVMDQVRSAGLNTVLFQVRGNGTAFYRSSIEPLAYEYTNGDPGFDPLSVACREAHRRGLALHAWVNVMPAWCGGEPPPDSDQLYNAHPEWCLYDQKGKRQPLGSFYVSLNPCLPAVRAYLVRVFREIVERYPVDGLHLDYIRFPTEESPPGSDYPYDPKTLALYKKATGRNPRDDPARWSEWRTQRVTQLVRDIRSMMRRARPEAKLTAACAADIDPAREQHFQDGSAWLRGHLVDLVFVMNYSADPRTFRLRQEAWQRAAAGRPLAAGIGLYLHASDRVTVDQLKLARQWGGAFSLFSSGCLLDGSSRSRQRLTAIRPILLDMQARAPRREHPSDSPVSAKVGVTWWMGSASGRAKPPARVVAP